MTAGTAEAPVRAPRVWLVLGDKVGDNRQVERVAEALGVPFEVRRVRFRPRWREGKPPFLPSLFHVDRDASDALTPPWPDLVLTIGRRPAMAALWIRRRSGNRTRLVLFGRPKRFFDDFALVIAPAQYGMPQRDSVVRLGLPLIRLEPERVDAEAERWRERLADLPRPLTVLLVGGRTKPYRMDVDVARDMLTRTLAQMPAGGGLYVSTSRRTPAAVVEALRRGLPAGARLHAFDAAGGENPYLALLGHGDRFVVTGDSVSMLTEIARLGKPLVIYPLPIEADRARGWHDALRAGGPLARAVDRLRELGLAGWPRDLEALHDLLVERGWARRIGTAGTVAAAAPEDELERVAQRVRALLDTSAQARADGPASAER
ncbi:MAG TPA: ELM1/GtrOC1 family putative glycosyltransferase [Pseudomonadales bacterium]|nr:ELM1/GtrOC1 family putative glycosyltransferase [Pseudomonadales bacterium]